MPHASHDLYRTYSTSLAQHRGQKTEHSDRGALQQLLTALAKELTENNPSIISEPKRDQDGFGTPDIQIAKNECTIGFIETKTIDTNLDTILKSKQIKKYCDLTDNLIVTNYVTFIWMVKGIEADRAVLCLASELDKPRPTLNSQNIDQVQNLLHKFLTAAPQKITRSQDLAKALSKRTRWLRNALLEQLTQQQKNHQHGRLFAIFEDFRNIVFNKLTLDIFADTLAQTLTYGLFLAKLRADTRTIRLADADQHIPASIQLLREVFGFLRDLDQEQNNEITTWVNAIIDIMNGVDLREIKRDLSFNKTQRRIDPDMDDEDRVLFDTDPYIYFYEDFLREYDKATRKGRGVYYTPPPVVRFIVRAINDSVQRDFAMPAGLADANVTVLDFATGTGTFLIEILTQILQGKSPVEQETLIRDHILKNIYGFEYLIAPYAIAHLKVSEFLREKGGYDMQLNERVQVYLTNTLEDKPQAEPSLFMPELTKEGKAAQDIKDKKEILVITGNPPYAVESKNTGKWITDLVNDAYKSVDGKPLGERNSKMLQDDYVKFIRFAQHKMELVEHGIVGIITNHSFIDNPTFRGMRYSLMNTFDAIYIMDLHGNAKKRETAPDGSPDKNVFDIEQGVALSLFIKKRDIQDKGVFHTDVFGKRPVKYRALYERTLQNTQWTTLQPNSPFYFFVPRNETHRAEYEQGWQVTKIFNVYSIGVVTARDSLTIHFEQKKVWDVMTDFVNLSPEDAREKYKLRADTRDWKVELAQQDLKDSALNKDLIVPITYRPFDKRYTYYTGNSRGFHSMSRKQVMQHMLAGDNLGLNVSRQFKTGNTWQHCLIANTIVESTYISNRTSEGGTLFPLYLYEKGQWVENFTTEFRAFIDDRYNHTYTPEQILGYIYAIMHAPSYRRKYIDFLRIDFPRIPFVANRDMFEQLSDIGRDLINAHLLKTKKPSIVHLQGNNATVLKVNYAHNKLSINDTTYFDPVPPQVWEFHIGGYQVLDKYLKSRKGRTLNLDDLETIKAIVNAVHETIHFMQHIDEIWHA